MKATVSNSLTRSCSVTAGISYADLAAGTGLSTSTVTRRLAALQANGMFTLDGEIGAEAYGITTQALLWMSVAPAHLNQVVETLIQHKELAFLAASTGPTNVVGLVFCRTPTEVQEFTLLDDQHCAILAEDPTLALDGDGDAQGDASHQPK